jgi:hypothetical protein
VLTSKIEEGLLLSHEALRGFMLLEHMLVVRLSDILNLAKLAPLGSLLADHLHILGHLLNYLPKFFVLVLQFH